MVNYVGNCQNIINCDHTIFHFCQKKNERGCILVPILSSIQKGCGLDIDPSHRWEVKWYPFLIFIYNSLMIYAVEHIFRLSVITYVSLLVQKLSTSLPCFNLISLFFGDYWRNLRAFCAFQAIIPYQIALQNSCVQSTIYLIIFKFPNHQLFLLVFLLLLL